MKGFTFLKLIWLLFCLFMIGWMSRGLVYGFDTESYYETKSDTMYWSQIGKPGDLLYIPAQEIKRSWIEFNQEKALIDILKNQEEILRRLKILDKTYWWDGVVE